MNISKMIEELKAIMETHGDLECIYASDDEGNHYSTVNYNPSVMNPRELDYVRGLSVSGNMKVCCIN